MSQDPTEGEGYGTGQDVQVDWNQAEKFGCFRLPAEPPPDDPGGRLFPLFIAAIVAGLLSTFAAGFLVGHVVAAGSVAPIRADLAAAIAERDQLAAELAELADASRSTVGAAYADRGDLQMQISDLEVDLRLAREALAECQGAAP